MMPGSKSTPDENIYRLPRRGGEYHLEEGSIGFENGVITFFEDPTKGAIRAELKYAYVICEDETDPEVDRIYWLSADNAFWEEIPLGPVHYAATDRLEKPERLANFLTYTEENSVEIPRMTFADYVRESQRRQAA